MKWFWDMVITQYTEVEKRKLLLSMIEEGIVGDVIDLVVSATKGELDVNAIEKVAVGCCLSVLKSRQSKTNNKI